MSSRFLGSVVAGGDFVPVDDVEEGGDVFGAAVLVFQVVGVFPNVEAENGGATLRVGGVLVRERFDHETAGAIDGEPGPAAAEDSCGGFGELIFEGVEG